MDNIKRNKSNGQPRSRSLLNNEGDGLQLIDADGNVVCEAFTDELSAINLADDDEEPESNQPDEDEDEDEAGMAADSADGLKTEN